MKVTEKGKEILVFMRGTEPNQFLLAREIADGVEDFHATSRGVASSAGALVKRGLLVSRQTEETVLEYAITKLGREIELD